MSLSGPTILEVVGKVERSELANGADSEMLKEAIRALRGER